MAPKHIHVRTGADAQTAKLHISTKKSAARTESYSGHTTPQEGVVMSCGHRKLYRSSVQRGRLRLVLWRSGGPCAALAPSPPLSRLCCPERAVTRYRTASYLLPRAEAALRISTVNHVGGA